MTSCFLKQALDHGARAVQVAGASGAQPKSTGTKVRGVGVAISCFRRRIERVRRADRDHSRKAGCAFQSGIGNLGTEAVIDVHRAAAEMLGVPWERCDIVWGDTAKNMPYTCDSGGSQTTHAMTRAAYAVALECKQRLQEVAAKDRSVAIPEDYEVANVRVARKGGGAGMSFAEAAQKAIQLGGIYDGHEVNQDVNKYTQQSVTAWPARD